MLNHEDSAEVQENACTILYSVSCDDKRYYEMVLNCGVVDLVLKAMRNHEYSDKVLESACLTLYMLMSSDNVDGDYKKRILDTGFVALVLHAMTMYEINVKLPGTACVILSYLALKYDTKERITDGGGIEIVLEATKCHHIDPGLLGRACELLILLSCEDQNNWVVFDIREIHLTLEAMKSHESNAIVQKTTCNLLFHCTDNKFFEQSMEFILDTGGMISVLKSIKNHMHNSSVLGDVCSLLLPLVFHSKHMKRMFINEEGLQLLLEVMKKHGHNLRIQEQMCKVLHYVIRNYEQESKGVVVDVVKAGCIESIMQVMKNHGGNSSIQGDILYTLSHLIVVENTAEEIATREGFDLTLTAMKNHESCLEVQKYSCALLFLLALTSKQTEDLGKIFDEGGIDLTLTAMRNHNMNDYILIRSFGLLNHLADASNIRKRIMAAGGAEITLITMKNHKTNYDIQSYACALLSKITFYDDEYSPKIVHIGGIDLVLKAMVKHEQISSIQTGALVLLTNLVRVPEICESVIDANGVEIALTAMKNHETDAVIQWYACVLISMYTSHNNKYIPKIVDLDGIDLVLMAMKEHVNKPSIQTEAFTLLIDLAFNTDSWDRIINAGITILVLQAMAKHKTDVKMHENAFILLSYLVNYDDERTKVIAGKGMNLLVESINTHKGSSIIQKDGGALLWRITSDCANNKWEVALPKNYVVENVYGEFDAKQIGFVAKATALYLINCKSDTVLLFHKAAYEFLGLLVVSDDRIIKNAFCDDEGLDNFVQVIFHYVHITSVPVALRYLELAFDMIGIGTDDALGLVRYVMKLHFAALHIFTRVMMNQIHNASVLTQAFVALHDWFPVYYGAGLVEWNQKQYCKKVILAAMEIHESNEEFQVRADGVLQHLRLDDQEIHKNIGQLTGCAAAVLQHLGVDKWN